MRIKIACPYNVVTGGIELLHQVANELNTYNDIEAYIWYPFNYAETSVPNEYLCYHNKVNNNVEHEDILLFPEIWVGLSSIYAYARHKKIIYWESVDNYFGHNQRKDWFKFDPDLIHISQGEYSNRFLAQLNIPHDNIIEITDYVNDEYLECNYIGERNPVVLYNPVKGAEFTDKLIQYVSDIKFVPVTGMNRAQIIDLMKHSMVWIDFGNFPGKDRLPREAASCGMCVITGKRGSAKYDEDLGIPEYYKIDNANFADLKRIADIIRSILNHFDDHSRMFRPYRARVQNEKNQFKKGINLLVEKLCE